ncbi:putative ABC transport system ATP-binding protein [Halarchaeum rubridurum]|uniref:Peptide ABC transporter ATP-binding protein n=1 Tax=Halarchaeum rubridurum TaxID=489911 RepID=A0A830FTV4_9EURY|nr:ABC transporter ATP-binding protein [Halarchaeum rubridurum]MBP1954368.1 putative ABC transport system ATP-binding protein [Halarchaeum rubridurum]GGM60419.1 peptide ABC transporter ATP-binding protein [Halarchaeum rubridurum]
MSDAPPVLDARDLTLTRGGRAILDGLSLRVPADARTLVRGASGAGKSTLFEVLGLLTTPDSGTLRVRGRDATALPERERAALRRDHLGFVFQSFRLLDDLTAYENARVPQEHAGATDEAWLDTLFERLGIADLASRRPPALSGGERQRVAIARALANRPSVVLADEPTGQLDPATTDAVLETLDAVRDDFDTALLVVSHDPRLAERFDDRYVLRDGTLARD